MNDDPKGDAWFFKIRINDTAELDEFMDEDEYKAMIE